MKLKQVFLWANVFVFVISLLLTVFFFVKIWAFDRDLQNEFKKGNCKINSILITEKMTFWPCNTENDNLWWFSYYKDNFLNEVVMKGTDPKENVDSETEVNFQKCYHGIISVSFNFSDPSNNDQMTLANSNISGLYSQNQTWVGGYLSQFIEKQKGSGIIDCYYKPSNPYQVLPFLPQISNLGLIWGSIFLTSTCISFILIIVFFFNRFRYRKVKYQIFLNNSNSLNSSSGSSISKKSIGGSMSSSSTGKISTAGVVSVNNNSSNSDNKNSGASGSGKNNLSSSKNKHVIESTLEFTDFSFNLQQVTNQKPPKSALKQPINPNSVNSSPFSSSPSSSSKKKHKVIDHDPSGSLDQLNLSEGSSSNSSSNTNSPPNNQKN
ncbi:hypothetical protein RB653_003738 [Dictyostelium firmibasis]|uniref:Transmembrane protein n=1 Tax=Dictyostelium firmibasis TaxID=79012 RepID=A0AAN7Z2S0_9MYCE